ncbi:MAG: hypothetical protein H0X62_01260 [Bacteroidetes bacterium]|nr:hypothetical protein [Bacteroidota bacterium]
MKKIQLVQALYKQLQDYNNFWEEWIESPYCFLNTEEIELCKWIMLIQALGLCKGQGSFRLRVALLQKTIFKLNRRKKHYLNWLKDKNEVMLGLKEENPLEAFLTAPLYVHNELSKRTCNALSVYDNLDEILNDGLSQIMNTRGIGKKAMAEIKSVLVNHIISAEDNGKLQQIKSLKSGVIPEEFL